MPLLPPPNNRRGRGRRSVSGEVPPLPLLSPDDIARLTMPEADGAADVPPPVAEVPKEPHDPTRLTTVEQNEFIGVLEEILSRRADSLSLYKPMPAQERFHASDADERLAIGGNRGGKTTVTMVEIARAVTGQDPYDKYPQKDGIFILVAMDLAKCAKVFYRKLFMAGAFQMIRDLETGNWRPYDPELDGDREEEAKPAPPLIPHRFVAEISWENKKDRIPKTVRLKNGWELWFYSSGGEWPQGVDVDGVCFDEELERDGWYNEMAARLADRRKKNRKTGKVRSGKFIWSATPQSGTIQLYELFNRALLQFEERQEALARGETPLPLTIESYHFGIMDNPYLAQHAKDSLIEKYKGNEEEYAVRIEGKFALTGLRIYPEFTPRGIHGVPAFPIPDDWTRYIFVDPGHQICAVLFVAVPPPGHELALSGGRVRKVIYDELYIRRCNAHIFADKLCLKVGGTAIQSGTIDHRAGAQTEMGSGLTHEQWYIKALKAKGFKFEGSGLPHFAWSSDDVQGGIAAVHQGLHIIDGQSDWLVMRDKVPAFIEEAMKYCKRKNAAGVILDEPLKFNDHLMDCWRYAAMAQLRHIRPRSKKSSKGYTTDYLEAKKLRAKHKAQKLGGYGGSYKVG